MTARDSLRRAVAAEFQRLDAHQFGYDHGFCADPGADPETAAFVDAAIQIVAEEFAAALLAVDPVEWALAGQHAGADAAKLIRRLVATPASTGGHSCGNCEGIDPDSCLANPDRATTPTSKEPS